MVNENHKMKTMGKTIGKYAGSVLALVLLCAFSVPSQAKEVRSRTYHYQFETTYPRDAVMEVFYQVKHFRKFAKGAEKVTTIEKQAQSYIVQYEYSHFWGHVKVRFKKSIFPDQGKVTFELMEYKSTNTYFPKIVKSKGSYQVEPGKNGKCKVTYSQQFHFDKSLNWLFRKIFDANAKRTFKGLANYVKGLETN